MLAAMCMGSRAGSLGSGLWVCHDARESCQEKQGWQIKAGGVLHVSFPTGFGDNFSSFG